MKCDYCGNERDGIEGWHGCPQSMDKKAYLETLIERSMRIADDRTPMTSEQMRQRADRRREMGNGVRLTGGKTHPEYDPIELSESDYDGRE